MKGEMEELLEPAQIVPDKVKEEDTYSRKTKTEDKDLEGLKTERVGERKGPLKVDREETGKGLGPDPDREEDMSPLEA